MLTRLEGPATMPAVRVSAPQCGQSMLTGTRYHSFVSKDRWLVSGKPVLLFFWMDLQISAQNRHPAPCDKREMSSATLGVLQQTCTSMQFCSSHRRSAQDGEVGFGAAPTQSNPVVACSLPVADLFSQQRICRNNRFVPRHFRLGGNPSVSFRAGELAKRPCTGRRTSTAARQQRSFLFGTGAERR